MLSFWKVFAKKHTQMFLPRHAVFDWYFCEPYLIGTMFMSTVLSNRFALFAFLWRVKTVSICMLFPDVTTSCVFPLFAERLHLKTLNIPEFLAKWYTMVHQIVQLDQSDNKGRNYTLAIKNFFLKKFLFSTLN